MNEGGDANRTDILCKHKQDQIEFTELKHFLKSNLNSDGLKFIKVQRIKQKQNTTPLAAIRSCFQPRVIQFTPTQLILNFVCSVGLIS